MVDATITLREACLLRLLREIGKGKAEVLVSRGIPTCVTIDGAPMAQTENAEVRVARSVISYNLDLVDAGDAKGVGKPHAPGGGGRDGV